MKNKFLFSVLSYYPSFMTTESIHVGILFYDAESDQVAFETTTKWSRVGKFDDELDIGMFKILLKGIESSACSKQGLRTHDSNERFSIKNFTKYYVNELKFSRVYAFEGESFDTFMEETKKIYLRYDYEVSERPNKDSQIKYLRQLIRGQNVACSSKGITGTFDEKISFDYIINDEYAIKVFDLKGKELNRCISGIKSWALNAMEIKEMYKTVFIYNIDKDNLSVVQEQQCKTIMSILNKYSNHVFDIAQGAEFVASLSPSLMDEECV